MPAKQFEVMIRGTQNTCLEFENPLHEQYFEQLLAMKAFNDWCNTIDREFIVKKIIVQSCDMFGTRMGFVKFKGEITDEQGRVIPSIVFMRGASVGMLIVITCEEDKKQYTILTVQVNPKLTSFNCTKGQILTLTSSRACRPASMHSRSSLPACSTPRARS